MWHALDGSLTSFITGVEPPRREPFKKEGTGTMNENQAEGKGKSILGKAKEGLGNLTGNEDQVAEGRADQAEGTVQKTVGGAQKGLDDAVGRTGGQEKAAGKGDQLVGGLKERAGEVTGSPDLEAEGEAQQGKGKVKEGLGDLKEGAENLLSGER